MRTVGCGDGEADGATRRAIETMVVALDAYGTMLATEDPDNELPPRKGLLEFLDRCRSLQLRICTCSDNDTDALKCDMRETGIPLEYFDAFFQMEKAPMPKDFRPILDHYIIRPPHLIVIGDRWDMDIQPAISLGCHYAHIREYWGPGSNDVDLNKILIP